MLRWWFWEPATEPPATGHEFGELSVERPPAVPRMALHGHRRQGPQRCCLPHPLRSRWRSESRRPT